MSSTHDSGKAKGTKGSPQLTLENTIEESRANDNAQTKPLLYSPTKKHEEGGWGSLNPIQSQAEGQKLLETGYKDKKQIYNITNDRKIVKFQPANTPKNEYHAYQVNNPRDIPGSVLKEMLKNKTITKSEYNKIRKGKKK